jgi:hypothetical protein
LPIHKLLTEENFFNLKKVVFWLKKSWYYNATANHQTKITTEKFKMLRVIGEDLGQLVVEKTICIDAIKIDHVTVELRDIRDVLFKCKVVKQGIINAQIFYVNHHNAIMHTATDIPFKLVAEIPHLCPNPFIEVQNHLLDITPHYHILSVTPCDETAVEIKVVAHILTKVSEWVQRDLITGVDHFPKTYYPPCPPCPPCPK